MTPVETYRWGRARLLEHVSGRDPDTPVGACPGWRVRDVVAHVTGISADFVAGRLPAGDLDVWTAQQVDLRRVLPLQDVISEWDSVLPRFEEAMAGSLSTGAPRFAADVVSHSFDVATSLGVPAERSTTAVSVTLDTFMTMLANRLETTGGGRVVVRSGGSVRSAGTDGPTAALEAEPFEAMRMLSGRRTAEEIRAMRWEGDFEALSGRLSAFPLPLQSLGERA